MDADGSGTVTAAEPVFPGKIDGVDKPLLRTLATVCQKLYDEKLYAEFKPKDSAESNDKLDQPYEVIKGGEYKDNGKGISGYDIFNYNTETHPSLAEFGEVIDGITDFHGDFQPAFPPFAALIVQPKDDSKDPILILAWRGSITVFDWVNDAACSPTLSTRWSGQTKDIRAHGAFVNLVENTFSLHEDDIVKLIKKHNVKRAFFTGHSLGGGVANVAHLVVRGQLKKAGSPWAELEGKLAWSACTFAAPQTIVRLYEAENKPPPLLVDALDASSYNVVFGCDAVPRLPGMLKYMGDLVERAVPKIIENTAREKTIGVLPWWAMLRKFVAGRLIDAVDGPLTSGADAGVRFLKDNGIAGIVRNYTHQGTIVYLAPGAVEYVQLAGADIAKILDVNGKAFDELLGDESDWAKNLREAHSKSYNTLMFTGNVK